MTAQGRRFCPRCGTALVAGLPFCPGCGLNSAEVGEQSALPPQDVTDPVSAVDAAPTPVDHGDPFAMPAEPSIATDGPPAGADFSTRIRGFIDRRSRVPPVVVGALIVAAGLVFFGLLMRPQPGAAPGAQPGGQPPPGGPAAAPSALIVGLTIQSPLDGQTVATQDVTVIGLAPPGLKITRDVSFGLDQHATADGTGHWAMSVGLNNGDNKLKFRIGDDRSTEKELHVTYTPQAQ
jgi:hypothetical protein